MSKSQRIRRAYETSIRVDVAKLLDAIQNDGGCDRTLPRARAAFAKLKPYLLDRESKMVAYALDHTPSAARFSNSRQRHRPNGRGGWETLGRPEDFDTMIRQVRESVLRRFQTGIDRV